MKQEDKELLLKELCARLPYGVYVEHTTSGFNGVLHDISVYQTYNNDDTVKDYLCYTNFFGDESCKIEFFKPYLFPMSSMTEEQGKEFGLLQAESIKCEFLYPCNCANLMRFIYENHLDYMDLIGKGIANDATGLDIY